MTISSKFSSYWANGFRQEDFYGNFPWGSYVKLSSAVAAISVGGLKCRTQIWKGTTHGQNCSILSQNVPKFELYKHNDELFNIYYGIFYELWTFAYFDRLCKLEKGGMKLKTNLLKGDHPRIISAKFGWDWLSSFRGEDFF
jgi:hypothetical protein